MHHLSRNLVIFSVVLLALCQFALAMPSTIRVKRQDGTEQQITLINLDEINPIESQESKSQGLDREKRKLPEATFAGKNAILGFVFGNSELKTGSQQIRNKRQTNKDDPDVPDLRKDGMVSLDVPDQLFSQSFTTVTNLSKVVGNFMLNSARRYAKFIYWFKPLFGNTLTVEGHDYVPTTTTKKPNSI